MKLIGITGKKGSGKSTFAEAIRVYYEQEFQRQVVRTAFAQPLKQICYELFGGHIDNYYGSEEKKNVATPYWKETLGFALDKEGKAVYNTKFDTYRRIMQTIGTEVFRELDEDFWVIVMQYRYNQSKKGFNFIFLIDDTRFDNEASWILKNGGVIYNVEAPSHRKIAEEDKHASEKGLKEGTPVKNVCFQDLASMKTYIRESFHPFVTKTLEDCK